MYADDNTLIYRINLDGFRIYIVLPGWKFKCPSVDNIKDKNNLCLRLVTLWIWNVPIIFYLKPIRNGFFSKCQDLHRFYFFSDVNRRRQHLQRFYEFHFTPGWKSVAIRAPDRILRTYILDFRRDEFRSKFVLSESENHLFSMPRCAFFFFFFFAPSLNTTLVGRCATSTPKTHHHRHARGIIYYIRHKGTTENVELRLYVTPTLIQFRIVYRTNPSGPRFLQDGTVGFYTDPNGAKTYLCVVYVRTNTRVTREGPRFGGFSVGKKLFRSKIVEVRQCVTFTTGGEHLSNSFIVTSEGRFREIHDANALVYNRMTADFGSKSAAETRFVSLVRFRSEQLPTFISYSKYSVEHLTAKNYGHFEKCFDNFFFFFLIDMRHVIGHFWLIK